MKKILFALLAVAALVVSCDDNTDTLGASLTNNADNLNVSWAEFDVSSRSVKADHVLNRSAIGYLGKLKDPETGAYLTADYATQIAMVESFSLPGKDNMVCNAEGNVICDSCDIILFIKSFQGDSLMTMSAKAMEMDKPMEEGKKYYSDFDPEKEGMIRDGGVQVKKVYTLTDLTNSDSIRSSSSWVNNIFIPLNSEYKAKNGKTYKNIGEYVLSEYYEHPNYFKNSYNFVHNVLPGFYIKHENGLGLMSAIFQTQFNMYYKCKFKASDGSDSIVVKKTRLAGTEEVMQGTRLTNSENVDKLIEEDGHTYVKSPAGIFTEITFPVDEIFNGHENDSLNSVKITIPAYAADAGDDFRFSKPSYLLAVQKDSLDSFFDNAKLADYRESFIAQYSSRQNAYTFDNVSNIINAMQKIKKSGKASENWNKILLIPVEPTYTTFSSSQVMTNLTHDLSPASVKLVGGKNSTYGPLKCSVIYSKFTE